MATQDRVTQWAIELQSLAQAGLHYGRDAFDRERYQRVREIAAEMMAERTGLSEATVRDLFCMDSGYPTPKVDTRGAAFDDEGRVLLVRERDGRWSLPGGWCELNLSPVDNTVKELREEAGVSARVTRLVAAQDRIKHNLPEYAYGIVKLFYLCEVEEAAFEPNLETTERGWFPVDELPPLAEEKCTEEQIRLCREAWKSESWEAQFD